MVGPARRNVRCAIVLACAAAACTRPNPSSSAPDAVAPARRVRRLSSREYDNVVRDLLGDSTRPAGRFVPDSYPNGYDNGSALLAVQSDQVVDYEQAAEDLAARAVAADLSSLVGGCDPAADGAAACVDAFLGGFAARAFRRPLSASEAGRLRDVIERAAAMADFATGIETGVELVLQSPQFLYREELGAPGASGATTRLTDYEVASQLSFLLTGSMPDDALWGAVLQGRFHTSADYRREAERLLATAAAHEALRAFLHQWLATDRLATTTKDPRFYPTFTPALAASMRDELDALYDSVLWSGSGSLHDLFVRGDEGRAGVLARPGFLTVHADSDSSGPIARGVFVLQSILCSPPPARPANIPPVTPPSDPSAQAMTTRQRYEQHVADPFCARCHRQIDGIGFAFEEYDGIGQLRTVENGQPIDASGELVGTQQLDGAVGGAAELSARLSIAPEVADCFARQVYRYAMGQIEPPDDDLAWLRTRSTMNSRITDLVLALVSDPVFVTRSFEGGD